MLPSRVEVYITENEGKTNKPYRDTVGKLTIGVGFNLDDVGLYDEEINFILRNRIAKVRATLASKIEFWDMLSTDQQLALIDMCYNMGWPRLSKFKDMLTALGTGDYELAAVELLDSEYAGQVGQRAVRNATLLKKGRVV